MPVRKNTVPVAHNARLDGGYRGAALVSTRAAVSRSNFSHTPFNRSVENPWLGDRIASRGG